MTSFLKRSACGLKTLELWGFYALSVGDFERLLWAALHPQHLRVQVQWTPYSLVMDNILENLSASAPSCFSNEQYSQISLWSSKFRTYRPKFKCMGCIPKIFGWPHRNLLKLEDHDGCYYNRRWGFKSTCSTAWPRSQVVYYSLLHRDYLQMFREYRRHHVKE